MAVSGCRRVTWPELADRGKPGSEVDSGCTATFFVVGVSSGYWMVQWEEVESPFSAKLEGNFAALTLGLRRVWGSTSSSMTRC